MRLPSILPRGVAALVVLGLAAASAAGAGTLTPVGATATPIAIRSHRVAVKILDGYAATEVHQVFENRNAGVVDARYSFPVPKGAALCDLEVRCGDERVLRGEVVPRRDARTAYEEEKAAGNSAALAEQNGFQTFDFEIASLPPSSQVEVRFRYYQALALDTGIGRYVYPLEAGGTDEVTAPFWEENAAVEGAFEIDVVVKSSYPIDKLHAPGFPSDAITRSGDSEFRFHHAAVGGRLDRDFVLYYALADALPSRVELIPYRASEDAAGTFMLVVTPGGDLEPLSQGVDWTFVLDVSGSMAGKIRVLADAISKSLATLREGDRFRIITFADSADMLTRGFVAVSPASVATAIEAVASLGVSGSTNLEAGMRAAISSLDGDRAQAVILVTDGVANVGEISPAGFQRLLEKRDVRVFGFLLGNGANWPLMEALTGASGGFYEAVSNQDEIATKLALVRPKLSHEAMHGVAVELSGRGLFDLDDADFGNVYYGQQLVIFGRYDAAGPVQFELKCRITGEEKSYATRFTLPAIATGDPEIERLFAIHRVERATRRADLGLEDAAEAEATILDLGLRYQIVTDETSMLVLDDAAFARRGIARDNQERLVIEEAAQIARANQPPAVRRVDSTQPAFGNGSSARRGGSIDLGVLLLAGVVALFALRRN
jgi:Ca-activated chloride channel family protein